MKNGKKFRFNPEHLELIGNSFSDFKNDAIKEIAADSSVGGVIYQRVIYVKVIYGRIIVTH